MDHTKEQMDVNQKLLNSHCSQNKSINIGKLLCDINSPHPTHKRVDSTGKYVLWEGITIIMQLHDKSREICQMIYNRLINKEIIRKYVALLPALSYHVTLKGILERCKCQSGHEYNEYIISKYDKLYDLDKIFEKSNLDTVGFDFDIKTVDKASYAGLSLHFENAKDNEDNLRNLEDVSTQYLDLPLRKARWHLSLGYFHKMPNKKEKKLIKEAIKESLDINNGLFTLFFSKPTICSFKNMTHYEHI